MSSTSLWDRSKKSCWLALVVATGMFLAGCDSPQRTVDTLRVEIADFKTAPDAKKQAEIEKSFDKLQQQVTAMDKKDDPKTEHFRDQLVELKGDYQSAKMAKALQDAKNAIQGLGDAFKEGAKDIGAAFKGSGTK